MRIHKEQGTILGGVHLELTGEVNDDGFSVVRVISYGAISTLQLTFLPTQTECIGGSMELEDKDLSFNYRSHCDPRLNYEQSLGESSPILRTMAAVPNQNNIHQTSRSWSLITSRPSEEGRSPKIFC